MSGRARQKSRPLLSGVSVMLSDTVVLQWHEWREMFVRNHVSKYRACAMDYCKGQSLIAIGGKVVEDLLFDFERGGQERREWHAR